LRLERQYKGDAAHGTAGREEGGSRVREIVEPFEWYLGIDWGTSEHAMVLLDAQGAVHGHRRVAHTLDAIHEALQWVGAVTGVGPSAVAVGIETPHGALVDTLLEHRYAVFAVNPKQVDRFRDRFTSAGAKDDARDAQTIADGLRTDRRAFRRVQVDDPHVLRLRELCRIIEDLQTDETRLANRLREQLYRVHAPWLTLCPAADESWLWTVLAEAPHPEAWARLPRRRLTAILKQHRIRRITADDVRAALEARRLAVAPGVPDAVATRLAALVPQLQLVQTQRLATQRQLDHSLEQLANGEAGGEPREHRDVVILQSVPGVGRMVAATMLSEASGLLAARDYATLRTLAGAAPVTKRSGKRRGIVHMRYACNRRLRNALYHWARTSIQHDARARSYYDQLRARGHHHARALRSVANRWLRILMAMLTADTVYDPARRAAQTA
jgi:transposase